MSLTNKKIFILLSRFPYPLEKGDKLRAFYQIKELAKKHRIILCSLTDTEVLPQHIEQLRPYCEHIYILKLSKIQIFLRLVKAYFFSNLPFQVHYFYSKKIQKKIDEIIEQHLPKYIYIQLIRTSEYVKKYSIFHKTLDYMDAFSANMQRRAQKSTGLLKHIFSEEAKRLKKYEQNIASYFEQKIIISEQDKQWIAQNIAVIPNGVDFSKFTFRPVDEKKYDIIFSGNMNYPPNIEAAAFLVEKILPLLLKDFPDIQIALVGASPSLRVKMLASKYVKVTGWVDDISEYFSSSKIMVAPMFLGAGLQNKLLEAMAMKVPCITTSLANNALKAQADKEILIAETAQEFAFAIKELLLNCERREALAEAGFHFARRNFDWPQTVNQLEKHIVVE